MDLKLFSIDLAVTAWKNSAPTNNYNFIHNPFLFTSYISIYKKSLGKYIRLFPRHVEQLEFKYNSVQVISIMLNSRLQKCLVFLMINSGEFL